MEKEKYTTLDLIKDIWFYIRPYKGIFFLLTFLRTIGSLVWLYPPYAFAYSIQFFTEYKPGQSLRELYILAGIYVLAILLRWGANTIGRIYGFNLGSRLNTDAEHILIKHILSLDMSWHELEGSGNKMKRIDKGSAGLEKIIRMWTANFIDIAISSIGVIFIILQFDRFIGVIMIFFMISYYAISRYYRNKGVACSKIVNIQDEKVNGLVFETVNNIRTVKVMDMGINILSKLKVELSDLYQKTKNRIFWFNAGGSFDWTYAQFFSLQ